MTAGAIESSTGKQFRRWASQLSDKMLVMFTVYADETGMHDPLGREPGSGYAGVCGLFSSVDDWAILGDEWSKVLHDYGIEEFHFKEIPRRHEDPASPYKTWTDGKIDEFLLALASIVGNRTKFCVSAFFDVCDYNAKIPEWYKKLTPHPYDLSLKLFFKVMAEEFHKRLEPTIRGNVGFVFDDTRKTSWKQSIVMWHGFSKHISDSIGSLSFGDSFIKRQLQAADLLAYRMRQVNETLLRNRTKIPKKAWEIALSKDANDMRLAYYGKESLQLIAQYLENIRPLLESSGVIQAASKTEQND